VTTTIYDVFGFESWQEKRRHDDQMERGVKVGSGNEPDEENISILPESNHPNPSDDKAPSVAPDKRDIMVSSGLVWKPMSTSIDLVLDTHRSVAFTVTLWVFYIL
jgi:hypothetical protein